MNIVLDTNVLVSGIFFSGYPYKILQAWKEKRIQLIITPDIFTEYTRVAEHIARKYPGTDITDILNLIAINAEIIQPVSLPEQVCEDPDDDMFIGCALAGMVKYIISGDKHLLTVSEYEDIRIIKPKQFCQEILSG